MRPVPVLTYHAANVAGGDYATNDHVALAEDLALLDRLGFAILPLMDVVDAHAGRGSLPERPVAITFDDGTELDFRDLDYRTHGVQRGFLNVLRDFVDATGSRACATSFVIASPVARADIDRECLAGRGYLGEQWWPEAIASGFLAIGNHSWDHNHPSASEAAARGRAGDFTSVDDEALADLEILQARDYIARVAPNPAVDLFAYPYGESNDYLVNAYFPLGYARTGTRAAFGTEPAHVTDASSPWKLPRYVCGLHWKSGAELRHILRQG